MTRLIVFPACVALLIFFAILPSCRHAGHQPGTASGGHASAMAERVARGDYLVNTVCNCMHCHADRDFTKFAGPVDPATFGKGGEQISAGIYVRNITPAVLGSWKDDQIARALTTGITPTGDTLFPVMPYRNYAKMSHEDIYSIIAYLRTLRPIPDSVPPRNMQQYPPGFLRKLYDSFIVKHAGDRLPVPQGDSIAMGAYLVNAADCMGCHSPFDEKSLDFKMDGWLSGGNEYSKPGYFTVTSANITPDSATGIGAWTEDMFLAKFRNYRDPKNYDMNPGKYNTLMPWTILANMKDEDIRYIYTYLRSVRPVKKAVTKWRQ